MIEKILAACVALTFCACASSGSKPSQPSLTTESYWVTLPKPGSLIIIGASGRQLKRETEIDMAREDAARKAAMYHSVFASYRSVQNIGANYFDYYAGSEITLDYDTDLEKYMNRLAFDEKRDLMTSNRGVFIRFVYPASFPVNISYDFARNPNGSPEWTTHPPREINGLMAGVGYSGRQFYVRDTYEKSCDAAVADLVSQLSTVVVTREISTDSQNTSMIRQRSMGRLSNFLVLEIWADPETQAIWTLAVARKPE